MKIKVKYVEKYNTLYFKPNATWVTYRQYGLTYNVEKDFYFVEVTGRWSLDRVNSHMNSLRNNEHTFEFADMATASFFGYSSYDEIKQELDVDIPNYSVLKPYQHQAIGVNYILNRQKSFLIWETGTGKTKASLDSIASFRMMFDNAKHNGLVICPATLVDNWVYKHVPLNYPDWHIVDSETLIMSKDKMNVLSLNNFDIQSRVMLLQTLQDVPNVLVVTNYDTFSRLGRDEEGKKIKFKLDYDMVILDESHGIKNSSANRTQTLIHMFKEMAGKLVLLTGTPTDGKYEEYYSQFQLICDKPFDCESKTEFKRRFGSGRSYIGKWFMDKWISQNSFVLQKETCLDLPEKIYDTNAVELAPAHMAYYNEFVNTLVLDSTNMDAKIEKLISDIKFGAAIGEDVGTLVAQLKSIQDRTGSNEAFCILTQMLYCRMIVAGSIYKIDDHRKIEYLKNTLQDGEKVVIFTSFTSSIQQIATELKAAGHNVDTLYGATPMSKRSHIVEEFNNGFTNILITNPKVGGQGIDLVGANICIFFDNDFSYIVRKQAEDRLHRPGQTKKVMYIDLVAKNTIDESIAEILKDKKDVSSAINNAVGNPKLLRRLFKGEK